MKHCTFLLLFWSQTETKKQFKPLPNYSELWRLVNYLNNGDKIETLTKAKRANSLWDLNYVSKKKKKKGNKPYRKWQTDCFALFSEQINRSLSVRNKVIHSPFPLQPLLSSAQLIHSTVIPPTILLNKLLATNWLTNCNCSIYK